MRSLVLVLLALGCTKEGTIDFSLAFPPGQERLPAETTSVRLTLEIPGEEAVVEGAPVDADGAFALDLEVPGKGQVGRVHLDALDAAGAVVAHGDSPPLPIAAYANAFVLFMAPPGRFAESPLTLSPARTEVGTALLPYGVLLAGGRGADEQPRNELVIYNVYHHAFEEGAPLPAPRAGLAAAADALGRVYLFGGFAPGDAPASDLWAFLTTSPPPGTYTMLAASPSLARAPAQAAAAGATTFLVTGAPPAIIDAPAQTIAPLDGAPAAAQAATTATTTGNAVVLCGPGGVARYEAATGMFSTLSDTETRSEHAAVMLPGGDVLAIGGAGPLATALRIGTEVTAVPLLATPRRQAAAAVAGDVLVVAGGFDAAGAAIGDAEVFSATTLAPIATVPLVAPRGGAIAVTLANDSILVIGGRDAITGAPVGTLEIFTP